MHFPSGKDKYQTCWGFFCTVVFVTVLVLFTLGGVANIMDEDKEAGFSVSEIVRPDRILSDQIFPDVASNDKQALKLAFGFVKRDDPKRVMTAETGSVLAYYRKRDSEGAISNELLKTHQCT